MSEGGRAASPARHPWNTDFAWREHGEPRRALDAEQARRFDRDGAVVVPELLDAERLAAVIDVLDELERRTDERLRTQPGGRLMIAEAGAITFTVHAVTRSAVLRDLSRLPAITALCADLVGPDVNLYWDQAVYKKPEKPRRFPWHQDNGYAFVEPQQYLTVWIALDAATPENGGPWVAPGMHRLGTLSHRYVEPLGWECEVEPDRAIALPVPAGGAAVFSSLTPHLTGPNTTGRVRRAYILQYAPAGAEVLTGDPSAGPPAARVRADDPARQYPVLRGGAAVGPEPTPR